MSQYFFVDSFKMVTVNEKGKIEVCTPLAFLIMFVAAASSFFLGAFISAGLNV